MLFEFFKRLFQLYFCDIQVVLHSSTAPFSSSSSSLIVPCSLFSSSLLRSAFCIALFRSLCFSFHLSTSMQTVWPFPQGFLLFSILLCSLSDLLCSSISISTPLYESATNSFICRSGHVFTAPGIDSALPASSSIVLFQGESPFLFPLSLSLYVLPPVLFGCWLRGIIMVCIHSLPSLPLLFLVTALLQSVGCPLGYCLSSHISNVFSLPFPFFSLISLLIMSVSASHCNMQIPILISFSSLPS